MQVEATLLCRASPGGTPAAGGSCAGLARSLYTSGGFFPKRLQTCKYKISHKSRTE